MLHANVIKEPTTHPQGTGEAQCFNPSLITLLHPCGTHCNTAHIPKPFCNRATTVFRNPQGTGEAQCSNPSISWRPDGFVYGGTGSARVSEGADRGCNTQIRVIDEVLQPCCKPMADLIGGPSGLAAKAPKGSIQAKAYQYLLSKVKVRMEAANIEDT